MKVKALITAAGMGKRFGALMRATNKCLLKVGGKPLIVHILDRFREAGIRDVVVVTGYQSQQIVKRLGTKARFVFNPFYRVSGILGSFWEARRELGTGAFLFTTSDHFFCASVLRNCLALDGDIRIVIQKKKLYTKEDAKAIIRRSRVIRLGKDIPLKEANGEFAGMVYFSKRASRYFWEELKSYMEEQDLKGYMMEVLMKVSHKHHLPIKYAFCPEESRIEVDSVHDLIIARRLETKLNGRRYQ